MEENSVRNKVTGNECIRAPNGVEIQIRYLSSITVSFRHDGL